MPTPQEKLDAMLDAYQAAHRTATTDPGKELRALIDTTPGLKATFLPHENRAEMPTAAALAQPVEQRYQQVEAIRQSQAEDQQRQQATLARGPDEQARSAPKVAM